MRKILPLFLITLLIISAFASCSKKKVQIKTEDDTKTETLIGEGDNNSDENSGNEGTTENGGNGGSSSNGGTTENGGNGDNGNGNTSENGNNAFPSTYTPISNVEDLSKITLNGDFYLNGNIDMGGAKWTPIGTEA